MHPCNLAVELRFHLITNKNGVGLERDYVLLNEVLKSKGHQTRFVQFSAWENMERVDVNLFLEVVVPQLFRFASRQMVFPNPEWWFTGWNEHLPQFEKVFCKTRDCLEIFRKWTCGTEKAVYTGFFSADLYDASIERKREFLHVAGKSDTKNTWQIMEAWQNYDMPYPLTIVSERHFSCRNMKAVFVRRATDEFLKMLMNGCLFHLMPSMYEGWGHALHEGMGCKAVVATTDGAPMNTFGIRPELLMRGHSTRNHHQGMAWKVEPAEIKRIADQMWALSQDDVARIGDENRELFDRDKPAFLEAIRRAF